MTDLRSPPPSAPSRGSRNLRRLAIAITALLALWAVSWLAVPPLAKWQAEKRLSELLGREVHIERIGFSPWSLVVTVDQFRVASSAGAAAPPQLSIARVMANADMRSLLRLAPVIEALQVDNPVLRIARVGDGRYDFDDIVERLAQAPAEPKGPDEPLRFALYNLRLQGGAVEFDDQPVKKLHRLQDLQVALPFLSNLPDHLQVDVLPHVAFKLNGAAFDSAAESTPFAQDRASQIDLSVASLDLAPWLPYLPATLPLKPIRGRLETQLKVQFAMGEGGTPQVTLRGQASLSDAALVVAGGQPSAPAVAWQRLEVGLDGVQPLARKVALGTVTLTGAQIDVRRDAAGRINLLPARPAGATAAPAPAASAASAASAPGAAASAAASAWRVSVTSVALKQARVDWRDAVTRPAAALRAEPVDLQVGSVHWPIEAGAPLKLTASLQALDAQGSPAGAPATLHVEGQASDRAADARVQLQGLNLAWLEPYLAAALNPRVEGTASADATMSWAAGDATLIKFSDVGVQVEQFKLVEGGKAIGNVGTPLSARRIALADATVDLATRQVSLGTLKVERPAVALARDAQGRWNFAQWIPATAAQTAPVSGQASAPAWSVKLGQLHLSAAELRLDDRLPAAEPSGPVQLRAALDADVRELSWPSGPAAKTQLQLRVSQAEGPARGAASGRLYWTGSVAPVPLAARGRLRLERFPVHAFEPYFGSGLNLALMRGEVDWRGDIAVAQRGADRWDASAKGDARVDALRVLERSAGAKDLVHGGNELLTWQSLALDGLDFEMRAGAKPRLEIADAALIDLYSRLVITEDGRFNLRDVATAPTAHDAAVAPAAASAPASSPAAVARAAAAPASAASAAPLSDSLPIDIKVGGVRLSNGKIDFTDRFIKPNYSAALSQLNGKLGAFDSTTRDMATLELKGRAEGTALLEIGGSLNPTASPLALDIRAKATDLELAPLSPYAGRYAGYAIERGKLSMDVAYKIDPDGKLDAKNQIVLNQLTFGNKVESPDATKLPVLLAVALLKDRNGVIDLNLPVSGSINDPQFSVFGLVLKVIGNLLAKALTAPFALLAGGGGEDLSFVGFEPGTIDFDAAGTATIDRVAKALIDRPGLKMTVTGTADPAGEREAIQRAALEARIRAEQRRDALRAGAADDAPLPALTAAQRDTLIKRIYDDTKLADKPRNAFGFAKAIPTAEMAALLTKAAPVTPDSARELALQRGLAVRDALVAKGLPSARLFVAAPKLRTTGDDEKAWSPRARLALGTN